MILPHMYELVETRPALNLIDSAPPTLNHISKRNPTTSEPTSKWPSFEMVDQLIREETKRGVLALSERNVEYGISILEQVERKIARRNKLYMKSMLKKSNAKRRVDDRQEKRKRVRFNPIVKVRTFEKVFQSAAPMASVCKHEILVLRAMRVYPSV